MFSHVNQDWAHRTQLGVWFTAFTKEGFRLAPESLTEVFNLHIALQPPFSSGKFWLKWTFGCDGTPITTVEAEHSLSEIELLHQQFLDSPQTDELRLKFLNDLFKLPEQ